MAKSYHSPYTLDIPTVDIATFIFSARDPQSLSKPQYFDADNPNRCFSLQQAKIIVKRLAKGLLDLGLTKDDKVLLYSGNDLYFPILFWGTVASGCVFTGCSPSASVTELSYQLSDSGAKVLITSSDCADRALKAAELVGIAKDRVFEFCDPLKPTSPEGLQPWTSIWASQETEESWHWPGLTTKEQAMSKTAVINYSSGTTGLPKGVQISHYNLVANSLQVIFKRNMVADTPAGNARESRLQNSGERWLAPQPMFHAYGQTYYAITAARSGVKVFIMPKYDPRKYLLYLDIYRITFLTGVPALLVTLSKHPESKNFNLHAIESVVSGSAPLGPEIGKLVADSLLRPGVTVKQGWGLTECTCSATGFAPDDVDDGRSIGWLNPNVSARVVPVPGQEFGHGSDIPYLVGEIWISGPNIMLGYYNRPEETANTIVHEEGKRWLRTGDVGYVDDRGCVYIIDRLKELIKVKGLQVAPAEVEQTLMAHPGVTDCAVIGLKKKDGEYPKAFVVKRHESVTPEELQRFIEERLSKHKWLTGGVSFIDLIPRTPSGKVIRRALPQEKGNFTQKL